MATLTYKQYEKLVELFKDTPSEQVQVIFEAGSLTDVRDANYEGFTPEKRDQIRQLFGLKPLIETPKSESKIIPINRSTPFDPATFIGAGWTIWRGPADVNGLEGDEERDLRSVTLTQLELDRIQLVTCLKKNEKVTTGEERLKRLTADGRIRLDENAFKAFWDNREQLPSRFKERVNGNIQFIFFDGVVLRSPRGRRYALCAYFGSDGAWDWDCDWLDGGRRVSSPSAVLASVGPVTLGQ